MRVVRITLDADTLLRASGLLSIREEARAARYRDPTVARRFRAGRAALRLLIGEAAQRSPAEVAIEVDDLGRPFVRGFADFNLTHANDTALLAIADAGWRVGIDIEPVDRDVSIDSISSRLFHTTELAEFGRFDDDARLPFLLHVWTHKEAYAKATGEGIRLDLTQISFSDGGRVLRNQRPTDAQVYRVDAAPEFVAALCCMPDTNPQHRVGL